MRISPEAAAALRERVGYLRDLGVYEFYRRAGVVAEPVEQEFTQLLVEAEAAPELPQSSFVLSPTEENLTMSARRSTQPAPLALEPGHTLLPIAERGGALKAVREEIGDCTRCPLAFEGRHTIVFGDGSPSARLMFVGEGPGADEDAQGSSICRQSGQLLNNMITAMGLSREQVYIANIVKCRPPKNGYLSRLKPIRAHSS